MADNKTPAGQAPSTPAPSTAAAAHAPRKRRRWLRALMERHGWRNLPEEWWHFTLRNEPYPDRYFDLPVR